MAHKMDEFRWLMITLACSLFISFSIAGLCVYDICYLETKEADCLIVNKGIAVNNAAWTGVSYYRYYINASVQDLSLTYEIDPSLYKLKMQKEAR